MSATKPRVVFADYIDHDRVELLRALPSGKNLSIVELAGPGPADLLAALPGADFILDRRRPLGADLVPHVRGLRAIIAIGERVRIDRQAFERAGIRVEFRPRYTAHAVADLIMALILGVSRDLIAAHQGVASGAYRNFGLVPQPTTEAQVAFNWTGLKDLGPLHGRTLGLIGLGEIGALVATRARAFGMKILYFQRTRLDAKDEEQLGVSYRPLDELLPASHFVSLQIPDAPATRNLLSRERLQLLRGDAYLINASRGHVVDEPALVEMLAANRIAGAGLDVFWDEPLPADHPLTRLPNVILTPHIGASGNETLKSETETAFARILSLWRGDAS